VVGFGLVVCLWVGLGLPAGLPQSVELAPLVPLPLVPIPLEAAWLGLAGWLAAPLLELAGLELAGLEAAGLEMLGLPAGLVPVALGVAAGLVPVALGVAAGLLLAGPGLVTGVGWALGRGPPAATAGGVVGEQVAGGCPPPPLPFTVPCTPTAPLPGPDAPGPLVPVGTPPPIELTSAAASANICLPNGVSAETLIARTNVTAATAPTRRPRASGRRGVPGLPRVPPSGPSTRRRHADRSHARTEDSHARTEDSHTEAADSPIPASLAASERADMSHATGVGRGVVSLDRIRSRLSSESSIESTAECSAWRKTSSWSRSCLLIPNVPGRRAWPIWPGRCGS